METKVKIGIGAGLVFLVGGALALNQPTKTPKPVQATTQSTKKVDKATEEAKALLEAAEKAVTFLEANQVTENVQPAQTATDKVRDTAKKSVLQTRIDAVKNAIGIREAQARDLAEAERLVKVLEDNQVTENVDPAQNATNKVADAGQKSTLQARIDAVKNAIQVRADQAAQAAAAEAAAQAQAQAQAAAQSYEEPSYAYTYTAPAGNTYQPTDPVDYSNTHYGGTGPGGTATQADVNRWAGSDRPMQYNIEP